MRRARLTKREREAVLEALSFRLAGDLDTETEAEAEDWTAALESAQAKIAGLPLARPTHAERLLHLALNEIQTELNAAGPDEVKQHPMLAGKQRFVDRALRFLAADD